MQEQLISIETAKLAKKANFYLERTLLFSKEDGNGTIYFGNNTIDSDEEVKRKYLSGEFTDFEGNPVYLIVTQSLLQKWLREVHNIIIAVDINCLENSGFTYNIGNILTRETIQEGDDFNIYEEALEDGLQEVLKLIDNNGK
jgi:hypothetical protein